MLVIIVRISGMKGILLVVTIGMTMVVWIVMVMVLAIHHMIYLVGTIEIDIH